MYTDDQDYIEGIKCDVSNCYYNQDSTYCTAGEIKVGPHNALTPDDTACITFRPER